MATTFGTRPEDTVTDSRGNVLSGVVLTLYATKADALAKTAPVATVTTNSHGLWPYSDSSARSGLFARDPAGNVWAADSEESGATIASKVDKATSGKHALTGMFHASGFGAVGDGATDDAAAVQAAIDAADAAGGGVVYLPEKYRVTSGLLLPSNVELRGNNSGGQPGASGAYSRIVYAGAAAGTVISPKVRASDTINWGIRGLKVDGGGLAAILVEAYRVSYSRFTDLSLSNGQAGAVGFLFDANTSNQCYFNVADGCKVDGLPTGVRFTRGANANRWQGGKIGNGGTGMEFLTASSGNVVIGTDFENSSVKHVYVDAVANVFVGTHMEVAPIGYDVTANGNGTRRHNTTFAGTVTAYVQDASTISGSLDEITADTYALQVGSTKLTSKFLSGSTAVNLDPAPFSGSATVTVNLLRNVTTSGTRQFAVYKGDGSGTPALLLDAGTHTLSLGSVGLGSGSGVLALENRITAPSTNPAAGGVAYAETGSLRWKTSNGTVSTVAGDVVSKSSNYTATTADRFILATGGAGGITITLPAATLGGRYWVKKVDAGAGAVTVATTSSQTIDGSTTKSLAAQYASVQVVSDGTSWFIV